MAPDRTERRTGVRFEADEKPPILLAIGLGLQIAILTIGGVILTVASVSQKTSLSDGILLRPATIRHLSGVFFATHSCHDGVDRRPERTNW